MVHLTPPVSGSGSHPNPWAVDERHGGNRPHPAMQASSRARAQPAVCNRSAPPASGGRFVQRLVFDARLAGLGADGVRL